MFVCRVLDVSHNAQMNKLIDPKQQRGRRHKKSGKFGSAIRKPPLANASDDIWMDWILESQFSIIALINVLGHDAGKGPAARFARKAIYGEDPNKAEEYLDPLMGSQVSINSINTDALWDGDDIYESEYESDEASTKKSTVTIELEEKNSIAQSYWQQYSTQSQH